MEKWKKIVTDAEGVESEVLLTDEELLELTAGMAVDELAEMHGQATERLAELKATETKTLGTVREMRHVGEVAKTVKSVHDEIVSLGDVSPEDLAEAPAAEAPAADGEASAEDGEASAEDGEASAEGGEASAEGGEGNLQVDQIETAEGEKVPVNASSGNAGAPKLPASTLDKTAALKPWKLQGANGAVVDSLDALAKALQVAPANSETWIGQYEPYGRGVTAGVMTDKPLENFKTIHGEDTRQVRKSLDRLRGREAVSDRTSITAALNCKGPAEVVQEIPFCYSAGRPLMDSGLVALMESVNGQIQLYNCHDLPDFGEIISEAADCDDCDEAPTLTCATHTCIEPGPIMEPKAEVICMCLPESLTFSSPFVLERTLEDFAIATDIAYETKWLGEIRELSLVRDVVSAAPHGAYATIVRTILTLKSRLDLDPRCTNGIADYTAFVPGGEAMFNAVMADRYSRSWVSDAPGKDIIEFLRDMGIAVVFGLDPDPAGNQIAEGYVDVWTSTTLGEGGRQDLEEMVDAGTIYMIPRDTFATSSPLQVEIGLDSRDKSEIASGCLKMIHRQWWFPMFKVGCRQAVVLEFKDLDYCGTGPALTACPT